MSAAIYSPEQGTVFGSRTKITWSLGTGVAEYDLWLGTTGPGSYDLYNSGHTTATVTGVITLPTNGATIYAVLWCYIKGTWQYTSETFSESGPSGSK